MSSIPHSSASRDELLRQLHQSTDAIATAALPSSILPLLNLDLTAQQVKVLTILVTAENGSTGQLLAKGFGVSMASMSGMLDRLVTRGAAERYPDPHDQRVRRIKATPLGREVVRQLVADRPELADEITALLSTGDLAALAQGMAAVARAMETLAGSRRDS
ncbi:MarR family winged helix-turn-helix transcriptional regulator [Glutamicibacter sp. NPDC127525]|uniref:MarR family winged helix-turn-helix transcriptional regulator n=1 Tax=unclassified Glutamicibacter TaxID=2627139 RepID=UPI00362E948F